MFILANEPFKLTISKSFSFSKSSKLILSLLILSFNLSIIKSFSCKSFSRLLLLLFASFNLLNVSLKDFISKSFSFKSLSSFNISLSFSFNSVSIALLLEIHSFNLVISLSLTFNNSSKDTLKLSSSTVLASSNPSKRTFSFDNKSNSLPILLALTSLVIPKLHISFKLVYVLVSMLTPKRKLNCNANSSVLLYIA